MNLGISSFIEYANWLFKKYHDLKKIQENNIYRIIEIKKLNSGQYKITIQIIGKSSIIECTPQEIVGIDKILEGFSKKDVRTITYLACHQIKQQKFKVISQEFSENNKLIYKLKDIDTDVIIIKTANEIMIDKNILDSLNQDDIHRISYIAGYECSQTKNFN